MEPEIWICIGHLEVHRPLLQNYSYSDIVVSHFISKTMFYFLITAFYPYKHKTVQFRHLVSYPLPKLNIKQLLVKSSGITQQWVHLLLLIVGSTWIACEERRQKYRSTQLCLEQKKRKKRKELALKLQWGVFLTWMTTGWHCYDIYMHFNTRTIGACIQSTKRQARARAHKVSFARRTISRTQRTQTQAHALSD